MMPFYIGSLLLRCPRTFMSEHWQNRKSKEAGQLTECGHVLQCP